MHNPKLILTLLLILFFTGCRQFFGDGQQPESIVQPLNETSKIVVTAPKHGTIWKKGDVIDIKWIAPSIEKIKIQLFRKSNYELTISSNTENDGLYEWSIPNDIPLSNHYVFKVSNQNDSNEFEYSGRFGIQ
ncbi:MAG: GPI anchored serine-threonine rich family protein [Ignavibacteria bacterium]|nr:GPI anchored serine-threonine rich family protein [Ignavibacteria bacterium]MBT8381366.1 GPI anchored serine-threonine rich family protein [Ignavibacteria bacterium]MBT8392371.1 GPI anchored serine-threonine rich family protein [Ignavibacteria bacterium]NNJ53123.1 hypothetical protein [Ignavibacteriaceae bacterium]NNL22205.1 hypothetical protein [Ignavibacteriaceae bacterium]